MPYANVAQAPAVTPSQPVPTLVPTPPPKRHWVIIAVLAVLTLVIAGGGAYWLLVLRSQSTEEETAQAPVASVSDSKPTDLTQSAAGGSAVQVGGATNKTTMVFGFKGPSGSEFTPQVEVVAVGSPFKNEPTVSTINSSDSTAQVTVEGLVDGAYHWQARFVNGTDTGPWVSFGANAEEDADFSIDTAIPAAPVVSSAGGKPLSGGTTTVTSNRPVFVGTAEPGSKVKLDLTPGPATLLATADATGAWTVTPDSDIPNGNHSLIATAFDVAGNESPAVNHQLAINAAQATATPPPATTPPPAASPVPTTPPPAVTPPAELAKTGDDPAISMWLGLIALVMSLGGLVAARRHA